MKDQKRSKKALILDCVGDREEFCAPKSTSMPNPVVLHQSADEYSETSVLYHHSQQYINPRFNQNGFAPTDSSANTTTQYRQVVMVYDQVTSSVILLQCRLAMENTMSQIIAQLLAQC